ncbi:hypothetical protein SNEBB_001685 [Seison nebaliae]|nr:hypothetical protein SNEBB_001685 [Seison nebaliae]
MKRECLVNHNTSPILKEEKNSFNSTGEEREKKNSIRMKSKYEKNDDDDDDGKRLSPMNQSMELIISTDGRPLPPIIEIKSRFGAEFRRCSVHRKEFMNCSHYLTSINSLSSLKKKPRKKRQNNDEDDDDEEEDDNEMNVMNISSQRSSYFEKFYELMYHLHKFHEYEHSSESDSFEENESPLLIITYIDPLNGDVLPINNDANLELALRKVFRLIRLDVQTRGNSILEIFGYGNISINGKKKKKFLRNHLMKNESYMSPKMKLNKSLSNQQLHRLHVTNTNISNVNNNVSANNGMMNVSHESSFADHHVNSNAISMPAQFRPISSVIDVDKVPSSLRRVRLYRHQQNLPLGFYIRDGVSMKISENGIERIPGIFISRLKDNGLAAQTGLLHVDDEIVEVNGIETNGKSLDQVTDMMIANSSNLIITVKPKNTHHNLSSVKRKRHQIMLEREMKEMGTASYSIKQLQLNYMYNESGKSNQGKSSVRLHDLKSRYNESKQQISGHLTPSIPPISNSRPFVKSNSHRYHHTVAKTFRNEDIGRSFVRKKKVEKELIQPLISSKFNSSSFNSYDNEKRQLVGFQSQKATEETKRKSFKNDLDQVEIEVIEDNYSAQNLRLSSRRYFDAVMNERQQPIPNTNHHSNRRRGDSNGRFSSNSSSSTTSSSHRHITNRREGHEGGKEPIISL